MVRLGRLVVGVALITAVALVPMGAGAAPGATKMFSIDARSDQYVATGIVLNKAVSVSLMVGGNGSCHVPPLAGCEPGDASGSGHSPGQCVSAGALPPTAPHLPWGAMVGKLGANGKPFLIGNSRTVSGKGELFMVYNDCHAGPSTPQGGYNDNGGTFSVAATLISSNARPSAPVVGGVVEIKSVDPNSRIPTKATIRHAGSRAATPLRAGDDVRVGDVIATNANTVMAIDLSLGGRIGVNANSDITITGPRGAIGPDSVQVDSGSVWAKLEQFGKLKTPLEVSPDGGGTMSIKG